MKISEANLHSTTSVKQMRSVEQTGEITCSEWLTAAQLKLCGITGREDTVQLVGREGKRWRE